MAYRDNSTAVGTYRTLEGSCLRGGPEYRQEIVTDEDGKERQTTVVVGQWDGFQRAPDGWAAFDKAGATWRITKAEAAAIDARTM